MKGLDPIKVATHPDKILSEIFKIINIKGANFFLKKPVHKDNRELFIACLFAYAVRKSEKREVYIKKYDDPPDFELTIPTGRKLIEKPFDNAKFELVEITQELDTQTNKLEYILSKLKAKKLSSHYVLGENINLLIFLNACTGREELKGLSSWLIENAKNKYLQIFCIYLNSVNRNDSFVYTVRNLMDYSNYRVHVRLVEEFNKGIKFPNKLISKYEVKEQSNKI